MVDLAKVKDLTQWRELREEITATVREVLGAMPKQRPVLQLKVIDETSYPTYVRKRVNYFVEEWERVTAWLFVPEGKDEVPGVLCCHQTTPQGKDEPAGLEGDPALAFAQRYAERGYATLAPDCITAGDRISVNLKPYDTKSFYKERPKMSALGKMLWDHTLAIDVLCETRRVDPGRVGVIGHSLGGHNALLLSAFDERIQACVSSCGFTRFADDKEPTRWVRDNGFVYLPKLREAVKTGEFPFDWEHVLALGAPSATLLLTATNDTVFSNTRSCGKAARQARNVYKLLGAGEALEDYVHDAGHCVPQEALEKADEWFERWL